MPVYCIKILTKKGERKGEICQFTECDDFLNENINDDVTCVKKILSARGFNAWRFDKLNGCRKILSNFDKRCLEPKISRCEFAKRLLSSQFNTSHSDALLWACIYEHDEIRLKTGNVNEKSKIEGVIINGDTNYSRWPSYEKCKNSVKPEDFLKCFENIELVFSNNRKFTTSTEISIVYDDDISEIKSNQAATTHLENKEYEISNRYEHIDKCHLAKSIKEYGIIENNLIAKFVCIAQHESQFTISMITTRDNGSKKYGLFQIDDHYCSTNDLINEYCDVLCAHLNDDQFENDLECVNKIYMKEGFSYWPSFLRHCTTVEENSLDYCFNKPSSTTHRPFTIWNNNPLTTLSTTEKHMLTALSSTENSDDKICELAKFFYENKVSVDQLAIFACIVESSNKSENSFGMFGIKNDHCVEGICNCTIFKDHKHIDDLECARKVLREYGLSAWNLDYNYCLLEYNSRILQCIEDGKFDIMDEYNLMQENSTENHNKYGDFRNLKNVDSSYYTSVFEIFTTLSSTKRDNGHKS